MWGWNIAVPSAITVTLRAGKCAKPKLTEVAGNCLCFEHQSSSPAMVLRLLVLVTEPRCHPSPVDQMTKGCQWICVHIIGRVVLGLWPRQHTLQQPPSGAQVPGKKRTPWSWAALDLGLVRSKRGDYKIGTVERDLRTDGNTWRWPSQGRVWSVGTFLTLRGSVSFLLWLMGRKWDQKMMERKRSLCFLSLYWMLEKRSLVYSSKLEPPI